MKFHDIQIIGILVVTAIVGAGYWCANSPQSVQMLSAKTEIIASVSSIDLSADGTKLLSLSRGGPHLCGSVVLHDLSKASASRLFEIATFPYDMVLFAELAPDGLHALVGTGHGRLTWYDLTSSETSLLADLGRSAAIMFTRTAISRDSQCVAAAQFSTKHVDVNKIRIFHPMSVRSNDVVLHLPKGISNCSLHFSNDGRQLLSGNSDGSISIWDVDSGCIVNELPGHDGRVVAAHFVGDGTTVISGGTDQSIRIWQLPGGREVWRGQSEIGMVGAMAVSDDGRCAAWGGWGQKVIIWDLGRQRKRCEILSSAREVRDLQFSPGGQSLAVARASTAIRFYDATTGSEQRIVDVRRGDGDQSEGSE